MREAAEVRGSWAGSSRSPTELLVDDAGVSERDTRTKWCGWVDDDDPLPCI
jgi:hypothetical protein